MSVFLYLLLPRVARCALVETRAVGRVGPGMPSHIRSLNVYTTHTLRSTPLTECTPLGLTATPA